MHLTNLKNSKDTGVAKVSNSRDEVREVLGPRSRMGEVRLSLTRYRKDLIFFYSERWEFIGGPQAESVNL
jgi:hypothetical protein